MIFVGVTMGFLLGVFLLASTLPKATEAFTDAHINITREVIMEKVTEVCREELEIDGLDFNPRDSSPEELVQACLGPKAKGEVSSAKFHKALREIYYSNKLIDRDFGNSAPHHFNSEAFLEGRGIITEGMGAIKANLRLGNLKAARETLGRILHTLQDFYSHSNWVELGSTEPYINLIRPYLPLENLAGVNTPTCRDCDSGTCSNPILPNILKEKKLTSGYLGLSSSVKPEGKCSHGGEGDQTSKTIPRGGINKDERRSDNEALFDAAVKAATEATSQLLEDIILTAGNEDFLRMMGVARAAILSFVIDTTGSMSEEIEEARSVAYEIIDSKQGMQDEPSEYILVPFNDPDFGPLFRTTDPEKMKTEISKLKAKDGGDTPEMCLSGIQLALTGAPSSSEIYVFTDATAKDIALKDTIDALISSTKSSLSFFLTGNAGRRRRRSLGEGSFDDYKDLALASGGQVIQVSKSELPQATEIILDTSTSALVTVLQRARHAGTDETFSFMLDESLNNITIYITGKLSSFTLTNPTGVSQTHNEANGKLGKFHTVGNLWRIRLNVDRQTGTWQINIKSSGPYTLTVRGQSTVTFIYDFVESFSGPHPGYAPLSGRPQAGQPATMMLSVIGRNGPSSVTVKEVGLVLVSGPESTTSSTIEDMGSGEILVTIDAVPEGEFVITLKGTDKVSNSDFQRQSTTQMSVSKVQIQAVVDSSAEPGKDFTLPFRVITQGAGGLYTINAKNDRNFPMTFPNSLTLTTGEYTNATLIVKPPADTESGTDITLTLDAKSSTDAESNYVVLRLSVVTKITDFSPPQCKDVIVVADDCPENVNMCAPYRWELSANLTDNNGTGIESISLRQGNGILSHTSLADPVVQVYYNASCCSQIVEVVTVDKIGNVGSCYHSIVHSGGPPALSLSLLLWLCLLLSIFTVKP
uniref:von Willebrand factor A domain-containing protein 7-like n=1 Tax=Oryzias melastigma TaxID=30732 RepID=A0A3B3B7U3_ORYME